MQPLQFVYSILDGQQRAGKPAIRFREMVVKDEDGEDVYDSYEAKKAPIQEKIKPAPKAEIRKVLEEFTAELKKLDIPFYIVGSAKAQLALLGGKHYAYSNWPEPLLQFWFERRGFLLDPLSQIIRTTKKPYLWYESELPRSKFGQRLINEAIKYGVCEGYVVPVLNDAGELRGVVSTAGPEFNHPPETLSYLETLSIALTDKIENLTPSQPAIDIILTQQEREVLQCASTGCPIAEISSILEISKAAVKDAQLRARKKLYARNTTHACVIATSIGLI